MDDDGVRWDDDGHSTRAYEAWKRARSEISAYFALTQELTGNHYDRLWKEASEEPGDGRGDVASAFDDRVKGLWPTSYEEILCASCYVLLVAYFEVYLEDAVQEVGHALGFRMLARGKQDGPDFESLRKFYSKIGCPVGTPAISEIRGLRHWVAHRRASVESRPALNIGELQNLRDMRSRRVLPDDITSAITELDRVVRSVDPTMWNAAWRGAPSERLLALVAWVEDNAADPTA